MSSSDGHVLPDVLQHGLKIVFCGTAASRRAAETQSYYAHPTNRFWWTLYKVGLAPRLLHPHEFEALLDYGIGLTDLAKLHSGTDKELPANAFDLVSFRQKMEQHAPKVVAFTSKNAGRNYFGKRVRFGYQPDKIAMSEVFVLPSPSGLASRSWDVKYWQELADFVKTAKKPALSKSVGE
jgi:TDG/mug DNA glycosylase family protein